MTKEYHFTYKEYHVCLTHYLTGVILASINSDDAYFTHRFMDYTKTEIVDKVKQLINERK
jgi:hypothetical protein